MEDTIMWDWPTVHDAKYIEGTFSGSECALVTSMEQDVPAGGMSYNQLCRDHGHDAVDRLLWAGVLRWTLQGRWGVRLSELGRLCVHRGRSRQERLNAALAQIVRQTPWRRKLDLREYTWYRTVEAARDHNLSIDEVASAYDALHAPRERLVAWDRDTPRRGDGNAWGDLYTVACELAAVTVGEHRPGDDHLDWWIIAIAGVGSHGYVPHAAWPNTQASLDDVRVARRDPETTVAGGPELPEKRVVR